MILLLLLLLLYDDYYFYFVYLVVMLLVASMHAPLKNENVFFYYYIRGRPRFQKLFIFFYLSYSLTKKKKRNELCSNTVSFASFFFLFCF